MAQVITHTSGSSEWFDRGFVTYSNEAKTELLGVRPETIKTTELAFDDRPSDKLWGAWNIFSYDIKGLIDVLRETWALDQPGETLARQAADAGDRSPAVR